MLEVFKVFYTTHYNFAAVSILLLMLLIYLLTQKNYRWCIAVFAVLLVFNVLLYNRTEGKSWTILIESPEPSDSQFSKPPAQEMTFSAHKNWKIVDDKGEEHHWCWVEDYWEVFANTDLVAKIWGENSSKKMMQSSEKRLNTNGE